MRRLANSGWLQSPPVRRLAPVVALAAVACWIPYQLELSDVTLYDRMGLYALVAVGLSLLMGFAGQTSLGQGAFFLIGAYVAGILTVGLAPSERLDPASGLPPLLALICAPLLTGVLAAVIGVPLLRLRGHYLAFATIALHLIAFTAVFAQGDFLGGQNGIPVAEPLKVGSFTVRGPNHAAVVWGLVAIAVLISLNLVRSRSGRGLQAVAAGEREAAAAGVNVATVKLRLFVFAAMLAGLAGGLYTSMVGYLSPDAFPLLLSIQFVVMVAVGGLGSVYGAVVGAVAIQFLEDRLRTLGAKDTLMGWDLPATAPTVFSLGVFALILISVMVSCPRGLLPELGDALAGARRRRGRTRGGTAPDSEPPVNRGERSTP